MRNVWRGTVSIGALTVLVAGSAGMLSAPASAAESGALSGTNNPSRFLSVDRAGYWIDNSPTPGDVEYPSVNQSGPITINGTCVDRDQSPTGPGIIGVPASTRSCLNFRATLLSDTRFAFQVDDAGAATNGRYLGEGSGGFALDLLSTAPALQFIAPRKVIGTLTGEVVTPSEPIARAGSTVTVALTASNTGNADWTSLLIDAPVGSAVACPTQSVPAGTSAVCSATFTLTQAQLDAPSSLTFTGAATDGTGLRALLGPATTSLRLNRPSLTVDGTIRPPRQPRSGDLAPVSLVLTNSGNVTLASSGVENATCVTAVLAPGARTTCTLRAPITQEQIDAGQTATTVVGTATTVGGDSFSSPPNVLRAPLAQAPSATLTIMGHGEYTGTVRYTARLTNTGNTTIAGAATTGGTCQSTSIAPSESVTCVGYLSVPAIPASKTVQLEVRGGGQSAGRTVDASPQHITITIPSDSETNPADPAAGGVAGPQPAPTSSKRIGTAPPQSAGLAYTGSDRNLPVLTLLAILSCTVGVAVLAARGRRGRERSSTAD